MIVEKKRKVVEVGAVKEFAATFLPDPILKMAVNSVLDHAPEAEPDKLTSAERQAVFRLGQMDMKASIAAALRKAAEGTRDQVCATLLAAAQLAEEMEVLT